jgi:phosphatidylglycerol---prolipoprotein diacylglyceryl transferase
MHPVLFHIFGEAVPAYFVMLLAGFMLATTVQAVLAYGSGLDPDAMINLGISMLLWGLIGGRLLHVIADGYFMDYVHLCTDPAAVAWKITQAECAGRGDSTWDAALKVCHPNSRDCFMWAKFWAGGLAYYGGFIAASTAAFYSLRRDKFPFWKAADMAGVTVALGLGFGRLGCFFGGCCFGKACDLPWAVSFPAGSDASRAAWKSGLLSSPYVVSPRLHPTQLYESFACFLISAFCVFYVWPRRKYDGQVFAAFVVLYACVRAFLEVFRNDDRGGMFGLSTSQLIGIALVAVAFAIHRARSQKGVAAVLPAEEPKA